MISRHQLERLAVTADLKSGAFFKFFTISETWGFKYFHNSTPLKADMYDMCLKARTTQAIACAYDLAPKTGPMSELTVGGIETVGYYTEIVPKLLSEDHTEDLKAFRRKLYRIDLNVSDVKWHNIGYLRDHLVLFDFSCCEVRKRNVQNTP